MGTKSETNTLFQQKGDAVCVVKYISQIMIVNTDTE